MIGVSFIVFTAWFRSRRTSPLGCQWKPRIPLGVLLCLVLREDKQSSVQEPHLQPASAAWPDISGSLTCTRRDQPFVPTWTLLSSGRHWGPRAVPPLVEILADHRSQTGSGGAWLSPGELWARAQGKWGQGVPPVTNRGRVPSGQLPKTPPRHLGKRRRVHRVADGQVL